MSEDTPRRTNQSDAPDVTRPWASPPASDPNKRPSPEKKPLWKNLLLWGIVLIIVVLALIALRGTLTRTSESPPHGAVVEQRETVPRDTPPLVSQAHELA